MLPFLIATALLCLAGASCILHIIAIARLRKRGNAPTATLGEGPPLTFWRALKPGVPDLRGKLDALIASARPSDQILVGIDANSADRAECEAWVAKHPDRNIRLIRCEPNHAANPKISKFLQMRSAAQHASWLLTDSESVLTMEFVEAIRAEWATGGADAITAGYYFRNVRTIPQILDALPSAVTLWPGLMLTPRVRFTLGACTAIRSGDLDSIGGWSALSDYLAEDHELGVRLAKNGKTIALSGAALNLDSDPLSVGDYLRHQHRVAVTYRAANPKGALGLVILHGMPLGGLAILLHPPLWSIGAAVMISRGFLAIIEARIAGSFPEQRVWLASVVPLIEGCFWLLAWFPFPIWWAGRWRSLQSDGRLKK